MKKTLPAILAMTLILILVFSLTSCVSYLGPKHISIKGSGNGRYIDYGGVRYTINPAESQKSFYWSPDKDRNMIYLGNCKEWFYEWHVVTDVYLYDNGEGTAYIKADPYYYFPEGISGFPPVTVENIDALILNHTDIYGKNSGEIRDRSIIEAFFELQEKDGKEKAVRSGRETDSETEELEFIWDEDGYLKDITLYNSEFNLVRPLVLMYGKQGAWIPKMYDSGSILIPDELYEKIINAASN